MGLGGGNRDARIDIGQLGAFAQGSHQTVDFFDRNGLKHIASVKHNMACVFIIHAHLPIGIAEKAATSGVDGPFAQGIVGKMIGGPDGF